MCFCASELTFASCILDMSISYLQKEREEGWREQGRGRHGETWGGRERERERVCVREREREREGERRSVQI